MDSEATLFPHEAEAPEATLFPHEAEALDSLWIPDSSSSMEGRFLQAQIKGDRNEGESYGEGFRQSAANKRRLTVDQVRLLERNFNVDNKLEHERKVQLAKEIGLRPRQVAVWFQNRRARSKTKKVEKDYESLNTEYDKLKKDYDGLVKENQVLRAEVDELRGKWAATEEMKNPFEPVEAMDSSVTELGKQNTNTMGQILHNVKMGSWRQEEGSRSSSKSDAFYSESPAMENQSQSDFLQDEEDELGYLGNLEDAISPDEFIDSFSTAVEDQPFCFWS